MKNASYIKPRVFGCLGIFSQPKKDSKVFCVFHVEKRLMKKMVWLALSSETPYWQVIHGFKCAMKVERFSAPFFAPSENDKD
jgi:hypothetical protein